MEKKRSPQRGRPRSASLRFRVSIPPKSDLYRALADASEDERPKLVQSFAEKYLSIVRLAASQGWSSAGVASLPTAEGDRDQAVRETPFNVGAAELMSLFAFRHESETGT